MSTPTVPRLAYRINEVAALIGISRAQVYALMNEGRLRYRQVDGIRLIPATELDRLIGTDDEPVTELNPDHCAPPEQPGKAARGSPTP